MPEPEGCASSFDHFVRDRGRGLWHAAFLLTSDAHAAEDLVQTALSKTYRRYLDIGDDAAFDSFVRTTMYRTFCSWWRRAWRGETPTASFEDEASDKSGSDIPTGRPERAPRAAATAAVDPRPAVLRGSTVQILVQQFRIEVIEVVPDPRDTDGILLVVAPGTLNANATVGSLSEWQALSAAGIEAAEALEVPVAREIAGIPMIQEPLGWFSLQDEADSYVLEGADGWASSKYGGVVLGLPDPEELTSLTIEQVQRLKDMGLVGVEEQGIAMAMPLYEPSVEPTES